MYNLCHQYKFTVRYLTHSLWTCSKLRIYWKASLKIQSLKTLFLTDAGLKLACNYKSSIRNLHKNWTTDNGWFYRVSSFGDTLQMMTEQRSFTFDLKISIAQTGCVLSALKSSYEIRLVGLGVVWETVRIELTISCWK